MTEYEPLPLARMATIKSPSFWIFFGACLLLYVYNKSLETTAADVIRYAKYGNYVCLAAFMGLFLNLAAGTIKNPQYNRRFMICCYLMEIAGVAWLAALIIIR